MKTVEKVEEFHRAMGLSHDRAPGIGAMGEMEVLVLQVTSTHLARMARDLHRWAGKYRSMHLTRAQLLVEELGEVLGAMANEDLENLLKELCDMQYVVDGGFLDHGLDRLKEEAFDRVHISNMSKLDDDGRPQFTEGGRVKKGDNYVKADLSDLFE